MEQVKINEDLTYDVIDISDLEESEIVEPKNEVISKNKDDIKPFRFDDENDIKPEPQSLNHDVSALNKDCKKVNEEIIVIEDEDGEVKTEPQTEPSNTNSAIKEEIWDDITEPECKIETEEHNLLIDDNSNFLSIKKEIKKEQLVKVLNENEPRNSPNPSSPKDTVPDGTVLNPEGSSNIAQSSEVVVPSTSCNNVPSTSEDTPTEPPPAKDNPWKHLSKLVPIFSKTENRIKWVALGFEELRKMRPPKAAKDKKCRLRLKGPDGKRVTVIIPPDPPNYPSYEENEEANRAVSAPEEIDPKDIGPEDMIDARKSHFFLKGSYGTRKCITKTGSEEERSSNAEDAASSSKENQEPDAGDSSNVEDSSSKEKSEERVQETPVSTLENRGEGVASNTTSTVGEKDNLIAPEDIKKETEEIQAGSSNENSFPKVTVKEEIEDTSTAKENKSSGGDHQPSSVNDNLIPEDSIKKEPEENIREESESSSSEKPSSIQASSNQNISRKESEVSSNEEPQPPSSTPKAATNQNPEVSVPPTTHSTPPIITQPPPPPRSHSSIANSSSVREETVTSQQQSVATSSDLNNEDKAPSASLVPTPIQPSSNIPTLISTRVSSDNQQQNNKRNAVPSTTVDCNRASSETSSGTVQEENRREIIPSVPPAIHSLPPLLRQFYSTISPREKWGIAGEINQQNNTRRNVVHTSPSSQSEDGMSSGSDQQQIRRNTLTLSTHCLPPVITQPRSVPRIQSSTREQTRTSYDASQQQNNRRNTVPASPIIIQPLDLHRSGEDRRNSVSSVMPSIMNQPLPPAVTQFSYVNNFTNFYSPANQQQQSRRNVSTLPQTTQFSNEIRTGSSFFVANTSANVREEVQVSNQQQQVPLATPVSTTIGCGSSSSATNQQNKRNGSSAVQSSANTSISARDEFKTSSGTIHQQQQSRRNVSSVPQMTQFLNEIRTGSSFFVANTSASIREEVQVSNQQQQVPLTTPVSTTIGWGSSTSSICCSIAAKDEVKTSNTNQQNRRNGLSAVQTSANTTISARDEVKTSGTIHQQQQIKRNVSSVPQTMQFSNDIRTGSSFSVTNSSANVREEIQVSNQQQQLPFVTPVSTTIGCGSSSSGSNHQNKRNGSSAVHSSANTSISARGEVKTSSGTIHQQQQIRRNVSSVPQTMQFSNEIRTGSSFFVANTSASIREEVQVSNQQQQVPLTTPVSTTIGCGSSSSGTNQKNKKNGSSAVQSSANTSISARDEVKTSGTIHQQQQSRRNVSSVPETTQFSNEIRTGSSFSVANTSANIREEVQVPNQQQQVPLTTPVSTTIGCGSSSSSIRCSVAIKDDVKTSSSTSQQNRRNGSSSNTSMSARDEVKTSSAPIQQQQNRRNTPASDASRNSSFSSNEESKNKPQPSILTLQEIFSGIVLPNNCYPGQNNPGKSEERGQRQNEPQISSCASQIKERRSSSGPKKNPPSKNAEEQANRKLPGESVTVAPQSKNNEEKKTVLQQDTRNEKNCPKQSSNKNQKPPSVLHRRNSFDLQQQNRNSPDRNNQSSKLPYQPVREEDRTKNNVNVSSSSNQPFLRQETKMKSPPHRRNSEESRVSSSVPEVTSSKVSSQNPEENGANKPPLQRRNSEGLVQQKKQPARRLSEGASVTQKSAKTTNEDGNSSVQNQLTKCREALASLNQLRGVLSNDSNVEEAFKMINKTYENLVKNQENCKPVITGSEGEDSLKNKHQEPVNGLVRNSSETEFKTPQGVPLNKKRNRQARRAQKKMESLKNGVPSNTKDTSTSNFKIPARKLPEVSITLVDSAGNSSAISSSSVQNQEDQKIRSSTCNNVQYFDQKKTRNTSDPKCVPQNVDPKKMSDPRWMENGDPKKICDPRLVRSENVAQNTDPMEIPADLRIPRKAFNASQNPKFPNHQQQRRGVKRPQPYPSQNQHQTQNQHQNRQPKLPTDQLYHKVLMQAHQRGPSPQQKKIPSPQTSPRQKGSSPNQKSPSPQTSPKGEEGHPRLEPQKSPPFGQKRVHRAQGNPQIPFKKPRLQQPPEPAMSVDLASEIRSTISECSQQSTHVKPDQNLTKLPEYTSESKTNKWLNVHFSEEKKSRREKSERKQPKGSSPGDGGCNGASPTETVVASPPQARKNHPKNGVKKAPEKKNGIKKAPEKEGMKKAPEKDGMKKAPEKNGMKKAPERKEEAGPSGVRNLLNGTAADLLLPMLPENREILVNAVNMLLLLTSQQNGQQQNGQQEQGEKKHNSSTNS